MFSIVNVKFVCYAMIVKFKYYYIIYTYILLFMFHFKIK